MRRAGRVGIFSFFLIVGFLLAFRVGGGADVIRLARWHDGLPTGGYSGLLVEAEGGFLALSDRGFLQALSPDGAAIGPPWGLCDTGGQQLVFPDYDTEALARWSSDDLLVALEGPVRIHQYASVGVCDAVAGPTPFPPDSVPTNTGIEALATSPDGRVWAIAEYAPDGRIAVWSGNGTEWDHVGNLAQAGRFEAVGADFGPDGHLYVLERSVILPWGFASRIRRVQIVAGALGPEDEVWRSRPGRFGNLEGLAVAGGRATMISDNGLGIVVAAIPATWLFRSQMVTVDLP